MMSQSSDYPKFIQETPSAAPGIRIADGCSMEDDRGAKIQDQGGREGHPTAFRVGNAVLTGGARVAPDSGLIRSPDLDP